VQNAPNPTRPIRKAVIPAAGLGTRFLPATKAQPKEMLPLVDRPVIQYVVEEAVRAGLTDILIVTGRGKRAIEDHFDRGFELEYHLERSGKEAELAQVRAIAEMATIHYVRQGEPLGLGHAVLCAQPHVGDEPFAVLLGDDVMAADSDVLTNMVKVHQSTGAAVVALSEVADEMVSSYGCAALAADDHVGGPRPFGDALVRLSGLVEKPPMGSQPSNLAIMGRYVFPAALFDHLQQVSPGVGGEIQLTDGMARLLGTHDVYGWVFSGGRYDVGNKLDYLRATVELALERDDVGPAFRDFLAQLNPNRVAMTSHGPK
jgi:UTP--glucose-1-phosphate uridylyltransferase